MAFKQYIKFLVIVMLPVFAVLFFGSVILYAIIPQKFQMIAGSTFAILYVFPVMKFIDYVVEKDVL